MHSPAAAVLAAHFAASAGDVDTLSRLISGGVDPGSADADGTTLLAASAQGGHAQCVSGLLGCGAAADAKSRDGATPLIHACLGGHAAVVELLLSRASPTLADSAGTTPLHWAAYGGHADCARLLLHARADPNSRDEDGTPLDTALAKRHDECAIMLSAAMAEAAGVPAAPIALTFANGSASAVRLCSLPPCRAEETHYSTLAPGASITGTTYAGHEWRVRRDVDGRVVSRLLVPPSPAAQSVVVSSPAWEWEDGPKGSGRWKPFDHATASTIAQAEATGLAQLQLDLHQTYVIDLAARTQRNLRTGFVRALRPAAVEASSPRTELTAAPLASELLEAGGAERRMLRSFLGGYDDAPPYWALDAAPLPASSGGVSVDPLDPSTAGGAALYQEVLQMLAESVSLSSLRLVSLSLVRNPDRFDMYSAQRKALQRRLGEEGANERWLWHGTERDSVQGILANGFLRDFNARGAYGRGVYFARGAKYSLSPQYAKPDEKGEQYVLLVRVLVGEACAGHSSMERPTQKPNSAALYESMCDRPSKPSIYVLSAGSDNRAYPELVLRLRPA